jgi:hypothetical protein
MSSPTCIYCGASSDQAPLIPFRFQGSEHHICSQHLPILIHEPQKLAEKLPGAESLKGRGHQH